MDKPVAWIINIGTELCIGRIVNTNAAWLARELTLLGINVRRIIVVPDEEDEAVEVLKEAIRRANIVITTGGLGPTTDDRTAEFLAKALNRRLVLNDAALKMIEEKYRRVGLEITPERAKMAYLPENAEPIPNPVGIAPGIHVIIDSTHIFSLPGVPREMEAMFENYVKPVISELAPKVCVVEEKLVVEGIPESQLASLVRRASKQCIDCYTKTHPKGDELSEPIVEVRVLASAPTCDEARQKAQRVLEALRGEIK